MIRFLRLFPAFVHLETRVQELESQSVTLQQRALAAEAARDDVRKVADAAWRSLTGRGIFGVSADTLDLPPGYQQPPPNQPARRMAREVAAQNATTREELQKFYMSMVDRDENP